MSSSILHISDSALQSATDGPRSGGRRCLPSRYPSRGLVVHETCRSTLDLAAVAVRLRILLQLSGTLAGARSLQTRCGAGALRRFAAPFGGYKVRDLRRALQESTNSLLRHAIRFGDTLMLTQVLQPGFDKECL